MTKDEQFALAKKNLLDKINSWADIYEFFDASMDRVRETLHPHNVFNSLFIMYAFIQALRELPEEGDIKVLAERMVRIMIYEGKEKLGSDVSFVSEKEAEAHTAAKVRELAATAVAEALTVYDTEQPKTLH